MMDGSNKTTRVKSEKASGAKSRQTKSVPAKASAKKASRKEQQRAIDTKHAILRAALREFADMGFEGASTREIATKADVNHRLIAHHFGTKENLWQATAKYAFGSYTREQRERFAGLDGVDEPVLLRLMLQEFILFSARVPQLHRFMVQSNEGDRGRLKWLISHYLQPGMEMDLMLLKKAQDAGMLRRGNVMHLRYLFIGAATSVFTLAAEYEIISGQSPFDKEFVKRHVDMVLSLFLTDEN